jgi:serine/threonine protein kinase
MPGDGGDQLGGGGGEMTIAVGTQLAPYGILSPLGTGGMSEVYPAPDKRLDRKVAIKLLPAEFAKDADRGRRL